MALSRVLDTIPVTSLDAYMTSGGGLGLADAVQATREQVIALLDEAGLRGRGGAGFPTGRKWRTIAEYESDDFATTVVVNAAEGEPGSFKDRWLIRTNPYRVIEGALVAAHAMGANDIVIAIKESFAVESQALRSAVSEMREAGWLDTVSVEVFEGPSHYLYGEETGLLEALDGRRPFPRVTPPWRRGIVEVELPGARGDTGVTADLELATEADLSPVPPALVNNAETMAHVATILANGSEWFRELGTAESPGSLLVTVSGSTRRHGVAEVEMGTPLLDAVNHIGEGPEEGRRFRAALSGVANPLLREEHLSTPLTYEDMRAIGNGLGAAGYIVFDDRDDLVGVLAAAAHFLAVESCGQCRPCKSDGLALDQLLGTASTSELSEHEWDQIAALSASVVVGARCFLAHQQQQVCAAVESVAAEPRPEEPRSAVIAPIVDIVDDRVQLDPAQFDKQPDWTHDEIDSGRAPVDMEQSNA